jgi:hypothetical protein
MAGQQREARLRAKASAIERLWLALEQIADVRVI